MDAVTGAGSVGRIVATAPQVEALASSDRHCAVSISLPFRELMLLILEEVHVHLDPARPTLYSNRNPCDESHRRGCGYNRPQHPML